MALPAPDIIISVSDTNVGETRSPQSVPAFYLEGSHTLFHQPQYIGLSPLAQPFFPCSYNHSANLPTSASGKPGLQRNSTINSIVTTNPHTITIMHHNFQSISNKISCIEAFLDTLQREHKLFPEILCFSETWLNINNHQCANIPDGYTNIANYYRGQRVGGGVQIFTKSNLDLISLDIDVQPIELSFDYCAVTSPPQILSQCVCIGLITVTHAMKLFWLNLIFYYKKSLVSDIWSSVGILIQTSVKNLMKNLDSSTLSNYSMLNPLLQPLPE